MILVLLKFLSWTVPRSPIPDSKENGSRAPDMEPGPLRAPDIESGLMKIPELGLRGGRRDSTAAEKRNDYKNSIHDNPLHSLVIYLDLKKQKKYHYLKMTIQSICF